MSRQTRLSAVEKLARQLRQWEAEDAAAIRHDAPRYPYTTAQTWDRCGEVLREGYRAQARQILRFLRGIGEHV